MSTTVPGRDERRLAEMGYKQELNRTWSGFSNFAISFTIISVLAGCFTTYGQAWSNGGPIAISWGWPIICSLILVVAFCMSELVSAYPTAGGIYWWASELGGPAWGWFTGWFNLIGLLAVVASVDYACATFASKPRASFMEPCSIAAPGFWRCAAAVAWEPVETARPDTTVPARRADIRKCRFFMDISPVDGPAGTSRDLSIVRETVSEITRSGFTEDLPTKRNRTISDANKCLFRTISCSHLWIKILGSKDHEPKSF